MLKSIIENLFSNYNHYIERIVIAILNASLTILLLNRLDYESITGIIVPIVVIISVVIPEIMAPIVTILFTIVRLYSLYDYVTPLGILEGFFIIVLGIILPIILEIKYHTLQAFISAESAIGIPYTSYFLLAGIAEKRGITVNVLSAIPLVYLALNFINGTNTSLEQIEIIILGIAGILIGAYLFGIRRSLSLIGIVPSIIGIYVLYYGTLAFTLTSVIIYISLVAIIISAISVIFTVLKENRTKAEKRNEQINLINKEIDETLLVLGRIKSYAELEEKLGNAIIEDESGLIEISKNLEKCKNFECIKKEYEEFKNRKKRIEDKINSLIFNLIIDYNNAANEIKKTGIPLDEIQIPKDKIRLSEADIDNIQRILADINKNTIIALNKINAIIESLQKLSGIKLNKYYITDYSLLPKAVSELQKDSLVNDVVNIINLDREVISALQMIGYEKEKIELSKKINDYYSRNLIISEIPDIEKVTASLITSIIKYLDQCALKLSQMNENVKLPSIYDSVKIIREIAKQISDDSKPLKERLNYVITYIPTILNIETLILNEAALNALFTILKDNEEIIKTKLSEEGCIKIEELGISEKFGKYIVEYFSKDGLDLTIVQDKICTQNK